MSTLIRKLTKYIFQWKRSKNQHKYFMRGLKHQLAQQLCADAQLIFPLGFHLGLIKDPLSKTETLYLLSISRVLPSNETKFHKNIGRLLLVTWVKRCSDTKLAPPLIGL